MTWQEKEEKKRNKFCVLLSPFPLWMKMVSTHNLVWCFGKCSLWGSAVISWHCKMQGCMEITESLLLQEVSTGAENVSCLFRNLIEEGDSSVRTRTMLLVVIVEKSKELGKDKQWNHSVQQIVVNLITLKL